MVLQICSLAEENSNFSIFCLFQFLNLAFIHLSVESISPKILSGLVDDDTAEAK